MKRFFIAATLLATFFSWSLGRAAAETPDYLKLVRDYADAMIAKGRDVYGALHTPLFAEALDRTSLRMLEGSALQKAAAIPFSEWGIRPHDRMLAGGNPQHCQNLYQILYALAEITGDERYGEEADRSLRFFFQHCQSPATGLLYWGEHAGWDFRTERPIDKPSGDTHEFYRPWVLWERSWQVASEPCRRFALGLWEHQVGDPRTGDYSRHAAIRRHGPGTDAPYARHGGFYIETWAAAYAHTREEVFLRAIRSVLEGLERARVHEGGMLFAGSKRSGTRRPYDISLAISLGNAAAQVPPELAARMREVASTNDRVFAEAAGRNQAETPAGDENLWSNAYGGSGLAGWADTCMLRYQQIRADAYRRAVLQTADRYRGREADLARPVWPGTMGHVILLMLNAYELAGGDAYLRAAEAFAQKGAALFLAGGCPLPKASHAHDHYEAVTNGDTLMLALLQLWQARHRPEMRLRLVFCDR